ncbi:hypothetical protein IEQ34_021289 [Dendrobium chrysotoxum]|uniref:peroxidase n=1 Tax=Dendrobium chrysotoxum TaxID=161865 RepID=A0AAV7G335_DENCH|nr:hypothetical protein IEQ34_021289 [Dendrobium chrysotoxum]
MRSRSVVGREASVTPTTRRAIALNLALDACDEPLQEDAYGYLNKPYKRYVNDRGILINLARRHERNNSKHVGIKFSLIDFFGVIFIVLQVFFVCGLKIELNGLSTRSSSRELEIPLRILCNFLDINTELGVLLNLFPLCWFCFSSAVHNLLRQSCPLALQIIKNGPSEKRNAWELRYSAFIFMTVSVCDGSILLDDTPTFTGEKTALPNKNSVRGFDVINTIKANVESACKQVVSCADIVTVAARDSVVALGGPDWDVLLGRRDSLTANLSQANTDLPGPQLNLSALISAFSKKGLNVQDMVALSGAHTIGKARCITFRSRIYNDTNINASFASSLRANCSTSSSNDSNLAPLDTVSPTNFDNSYYNNLLNEKGLLHSDQQLYNGNFTDSQVIDYVDNPANFFIDFTNAIIIMGNISPLTGTAGEIRLNCSKIN